MAEDISGMVVTKETAIMPRVLEATPVMSAMRSVLQARKNPAMTTPKETPRNNTQARLRVMSPASGSSPPKSCSAGLVT